MDVIVYVIIIYGCYYYVLSKQDHKPLIFSLVQHVKELSASKEGLWRKLWRRDGVLVREMDCVLEDPGSNSS